MFGLTSFEVYVFNFDITEENSKIDVYKFLDSTNGGISCGKVRDEVENDLGSSNITATDLQDEILGPKVIKEYRKEKS